MRIGAMNHNIALLQLQQADNGKASSDATRAEREKQEDAKLASLAATKDAAGLRGDAEDTKAATNAGAAGIGAIATIAFCLGCPIAGALIAFAAAMTMLMGQLAARAKEDQAAVK